MSSTVNIFIITDLTDSTMTASTFNQPRILTSQSSDFTQTVDETLISSSVSCPWRSKGVNTDTSPSLSFLYSETQVGNVNEGETAEGPNAAQQNFVNRSP